VIVGLVVASAFLHALWNALLRIEPDKHRALVAATTVATMLAAAVAGARWLAGGVPFTTSAAVGWSLVAGAVEWSYFASLAQALARGPLGPVYTISRGGAIIVVWPLSILLFRETATIPAASGSAIVLAGLVLASARTGDARAARTGAFMWALACALSIAGYHLSYKAALAAGGSPSAVFAVALAFATTINLGRTRGALAYACNRPARIVMMGLICGASFLILMEALADGGAGFILTLRNTSVLFATALAFAIRERPRNIQIAGSALVAVGAIVMACT
jgi:uncharacterized membrane protein